MSTQYHHGVRVIEVSEGTRPVRAIATAIIGIVGTAPEAATEAAAALTLGTVDANTGLTFTAAVPGAGGNQISIHPRNPGTASAELAVSVATAGTRATITINLETDGTGAPVSTAAEVMAAVNAHTGAAALVSAAALGLSSGAGVFPATTKPAALTGGADDALPLNVPRLLTSAADLAALGTAGTLPGAVERIRALTTAPIIAVRVAEGADAAATTTNLVGSASLKTGVHALTRAESVTGLKPRILGTPGLDSAAATAALVSVAEGLRGFVYAAIPPADAATLSAAIDYRANFGSRRLMLIWPEFTAWDPATSSVQPVEPVSYALGLRAALDQSQGWHKVLSNVPVPGPSGVSIPVAWDLQDPNAESTLLNAADITTLIRSEGYRFWGSRTCDADGLFPFESYTRTADVLADSIAEAHLWAVDKPMHPSLARDILETVNGKLRELTRLGYLLGGQAWIDPELNTPEVLKAGRLYIDYDYTPVPPLEDLLFTQRITDRYLVDFAAAVAVAA